MTESDATRPRVDADVMLDVLNFITENRAVHEQQTWISRYAIGAATTDLPTLACNTVGCFAGWVAIRSGYEPYWYTEEAVGSTELVAKTSGARPFRSPLDELYEEEEDGNGNSIAVYNVSDVARSLIGLSSDEDDFMFAGDNRVRDLWELASRFTRGAIQVPDAIRRERSSFELEGNDWNDFGVTWGVDTDGYTVHKDDEDDD